MRYTKMKKINKTLLLASTFLVSTSIATADKSYADGGYDLNVEPSTSSNNDELNQNQVKAPEATETTEVSTDINLTENQSFENETIDTYQADAADYDVINYQPTNLDYLDTPQDSTLTTDLSTTTSKEASFNPTTDLNQQTENLEADDQTLESSVAPLTINKETIDEVVTYDNKNLDEVFNRESSANATAETEVAPIETKQTEVSKTNYYAPKGTGVIVEEGNTTKYYENNKQVKNAKVIVNNKFYNIDKNGKATNPKSTFENINKSIYYIDETGTIATGIREVDSKKYYFNKSGELQRNRKIVTGESAYEIGNNGVMVAPKNTWFSLNNKRYYNDGEGKLLRGVAKVNNTNYYFNEDGVLTGNKKLITADKYYLVDKNGVANNPINVWFSLSDNVYKSDEKGNLTKGAKTIDDKLYVFDETGKLTVNKSIISAGKFYQADNSGVAKVLTNQWVNLDGKKYHTNENGYVKEGVWKIDNEYYYFTSNGLTANQVVTQKGVIYTVDQNGVATKQDNVIEGEKSLDKVMEWMFNARASKMTYNMGAARTSSYAADCSSAVYRALIHGGFLPADTWIGNTETLFKMGAKGTVMYEIQENEIQHGDIFVAGVPGASAGADGHTGFILNPYEDTIIHMNYGARGVSVTQRKGYMGDKRGLPVKYYRLVGANSTGIYINQK